MNKTNTRAYNFVSHWRIAAPPEAVISALMKSEDWARWWSGLESVRPLNDGIAAGSAFACVWRSNVGYKLRLVVTITDYQPGKSVSFSSTGDLEGEGVFMLTRSEGSVSELTTTWHADITKRWMRLAAPILRPVFVMAHHHLMNVGERGLNAYIKQSTV